MGTVTSNVANGIGVVAGNAFVVPIKAIFGKSCDYAGLEDQKETHYIACVYLFGVVGYVYTRGGYVELSKRLSLPLGSTLHRYDGLVPSVGGNGRSFVLILEAGPLADTSQSKLYFARMNTKVGFCRVRVPFSSFRPVNPDYPPLDPFLVHTLTICFEPRRERPAEGTSGNKQDLRSFKLIMEYIKALLVGE